MKQFSATLIPAYGRDYKSKAEVLADFNAGKDFSAQSYQGSAYCSKRDVEAEGCDTVNIRYKQKTMIVVAKLVNGIWK